MSDFIGHLIPSLIAALGGIAALYVSYRLSQQREWFSREMTKVVKENCAGRVEFEAHARADDVFQRNLMSDISEKRSEYAMQHRDHYEHAATKAIHQESMSSELLQEKFAGMKAQVGDIRERMDRLTAVVEKKLGV